MATGHPEENTPIKAIKLLIGPGFKLQDSRCAQQVSSES